MCQVVMEVWACGHTKVHLIRTCPKAGNVFTRLAKRAPTSPCQLAEVVNRVFKPADDECPKFPPCPLPDWPCCECFARRTFSNNSTTVCSSCGHGRCGGCLELRRSAPDGASCIDVRGADFPGAVASCERP